MNTTTSRTLVLLVVATAALAFAPTSAAHEGNHGTIKVHDEADADPDQRNEPHVGCDFFVEGFNMDGSGGELVIYDWPPTGDKTEVLRADWNGTAEEDGDGSHFVEGPFSLPSGHYRVEAFSDEGHPGDHGHFAKAKMFWVVCETVPSECPPVTLQALAQDEGRILVSWETNETVNLYRAENAEDLAYVGTFNGTGTYVDSSTTIGNTYTYAVTLFDNETGTESEICARASATAIPVFPTIVASVLAVAVGAMAYVGFRRR